MAGIIAKCYRRRRHNSRFFFTQTVKLDPKAAAKHLSAEARPVLEQVRARLALLSDWKATAIHDALNDLAAALQTGLGKIAQPVRVAVAGTAVSPPIDATLALLGQGQTLARIDAALEQMP